MALNGPNGSQIARLLDASEVGTREVGVNLSADVLTNSIVRPTSLLAILGATCELVCRVLGTDPKNISHIIPASERGLYTIQTLGGQQDVVLSQLASVVRILYVPRKDKQAMDNVGISAGQHVNAHVGVTQGGYFTRSARSEDDVGTQDRCFRR